MRKILSLEEVETMILKIQINSKGSEFELFPSQTGNLRTALGRPKAQPVSITYDKLIIWLTAAISGIRARVF